LLVVLKRNSPTYLFHTEIKTEFSRSCHMNNTPRKWKMAENLVNRFIILHGCESWFFTQGNYTDCKG
jgi:hypothetical protein